MWSKIEVSPFAPKSQNARSVRLCDRYWSTQHTVQYTEGKMREYSLFRDLKDFGESLKDSGHARCSFAL